jgi:hypothetical protein
METFGNILETKTSKKRAQQYFCEVCDYSCSRTFNWERHILTPKHLKETNGNIFEQNEQNEHKIPFQCDICNKSYQNRSGLWKHKQKNHANIVLNNSVADKDLIMMLIKENSEFKNIMMKVMENGTYNTINNSNNTINNTNCNNKAFNLNFFLNETCKNAMNITDFIESIKLQLPDLMDVGKLGFVEGISNIIVKNLNALDETERPIHCTDKKRETFYVKDQGQWEKEDQERNKIRKVIKNVAFKNERLLQKYKEEHPGCNYSESKYSDEYSKLVIEAMGGPGTDEREKEEKIIKNISKATIIK